MNSWKFNTRFVAGLSLCLLLAIQMLFAPFTRSFEVSAQSRVASPSVVIYDNGPFNTGTTTRSGVAAGAGTSWSEASYDFGSTTVANTLAGVGCQKIGTATLNRCADDFSVPPGQTWTINSLTTYVYQSGFAGLTSPVVGGNFQIWNGRPGDPGATVVAGNTTGLAFTSVDSTVFRIFNTGPPLNTAPGTTRRIWATTMTLPAPVALTGGTYWVDFQTDTGATTGNFAPPVTITGIRGTTGANSRQFQSATSVWIDIIDDGTPATADNLNQEMPFKLDGTITGAPLAPASRSLDFDGDNKTDFAIVRAALATDPTTWWIKNSTGPVVNTQLGIGGGFPTGDKPTPADFDGDGKTDIAFWRAGAPLSASFFILNSSTSTLTVIPFGQTGDDASVVDDYDGDGKADPSVYRAGSSGVHYYRGSLSNPGGNITFTQWGTTGDIAIPGDYDGDGKGDVSVIRNSGGSAQHWRRLSGGGFGIFSYGLTTDKFVTGDFDADGKTDVAAVRTNGANLDWYLLKSSSGFVTLETYGASATDIPVAGDYDGDNKTDIAVWRSGPGADEAVFFVRNTNTSPVRFKWGTSAAAGVSPDYPVANWNVK